MTAPTPVAVHIECQRPDCDRERIWIVALHTVLTTRFPRYCGPECNLAAWKERHTRVGHCAACGITEPGVKTLYGLKLCGGMRNVWWRSCLAKTRHQDQPQDGASYDCPICHGWHRTRHQDPPPAHWARLVEQVAAAVHRAGIHPSRHPTVTPPTMERTQ